jgi:DNA-directed RNA polymerase sigma subunit (sigma70/sigma32)
VPLVQGPLLARERDGVGSRESGDAMRTVRRIGTDAATRDTSVSFESGCGDRHESFIKEVEREDTDRGVSDRRRNLRRIGFAGSPAGGPPRLDALTEAQLVRDAQAGDAIARDELVSRLEPFVCWVVGTHKSALVDVDDLVQEGTIGLLKAIDRFDLSRGTRLTTFARPWIDGEVRRGAPRGELGSTAGG